MVIEDIQIVVNGGREVIKERRPFSPCRGFGSGFKLRQFLRLGQLPPDLSPKRVIASPVAGLAWRLEGFPALGAVRGDKGPEGIPGFRVTARPQCLDHPGIGNPRAQFRLELIEGKLRQVRLPHPDVQHIPKAVKGGILQVPVGKTGGAR